MEHKLGLGSTVTSPQWLQDVAYFEPRLAWTLLNCGRGGCAAPSGWEIVNISARWDSGVAANQRVVGNLSERLDTDVWVRRVIYTVRRPEAFAGSVFKAQSDDRNKLNPNIDFTMQIKSYCNYFIAEDSTPLENIGAVFDCVCPAGLVLKCGSNIKAEFINRRAFAEAEGPIDVVISLHGVTMPSNLYSSCDVVTAIKELQKAGILPLLDVV